MLKRNRIEIVYLYRRNTRLQDIEMRSVNRRFQATEASIQNTVESNTNICAYCRHAQGKTASSSNPFKMGTNMNAIRAGDAAAYLLAKCGELTQMKLHKILYYCQAYSLVWDSKPLFRDRIEAWMNGPVIPSLWAAHRYEYKISSVDGDPSRLDEDARETIDAVVETFGKYDGVELSAFTHNEAPWLNARKGLDPGDRSAREITLSSLVSYFKDL